MSGKNNDQSQRASVKGRGWQILRGTDPEDESPEIQALLEDDETAKRPQKTEAATPPGHVAAPELSKLNTRQAAKPQQPPVSPAAATVGTPEEFPDEEEFEAMPHLEAFSNRAPIAPPAYMSRPEVESLVPAGPEELDEPSDLDPGDEETGGSAAFLTAELTAPEMLTAGHIFVRSQDTRIDVDRLAPAVSTRPTARELFGEEREVAPDGELLDRLVTDERLEALWDDIHALQEEVAQKVQGNRIPTDTYQHELLEASALLLQSRANYDDVRAILYRVRADLAREEKVQQDIVRYRPQILVYLGFAFALWLVLMALEPLFRQLMTDVIGLETLSLVYHPALFGMLGGIVNAYFMLNKHAIQQQDFDAGHMSWYLVNPVVGLIMGLLMTLIFSAGIVSTMGVGTLEPGGPMFGQYPFLLWVLCFLAGYNQNVVLRLLNQVFGFGGKDSEDKPPKEQPPASGGGASTPAQ